VSRYTAIIRKPCDDDQTERIDCDGVHVDQGGDLHVQLTRHGDVETVARFQHGHWASYALEPTVDEELCSGRMTLNQYRDSIGEHQVDGDCCASEPAGPKPRLQPIPAPDPGDVVHYASFLVPDRAPICIDASVTEINPVGTVVLNSPPGSTDRIVIVDVEYDCQQHKAGTWHWPCSGDRAVTPESEPPGPVNVTVNVSGSVLSERDLRDTIRKIFTDDARRAYPPGVVFRR
jgi:hypothetical protein